MIMLIESEHKLFFHILRAFVSTILYPLKVDIYRGISIKLLNINDVKSKDGDTNK